MFFMIIRFVPHGDFLLSDFCHEFSVNLDAAWNSGRRCLLLEDPAHVVEEMSGRQHNRGRFQAVPTAKKKLSVAVALGGGLGKPVVGLFLILRLQINFPEGILRILISRFSGLSEIVHPFGDIFRHDYPLRYSFPSR